MHELISKCKKSLITVDKYYDAALQHVRGELIVNGKLSRDNLDREQHAAHGLSWVAAYRATLKEMVNWASNLDSTGTFNETEQLITNSKNIKILKNTLVTTYNFTNHLIALEDKYPLSLPSINGELAKIAVATDCKANDVWNFCTISFSFK